VAANLCSSLPHAAQGSIIPKVFKSVGCHRGVAHRMLNILVPEIIELFLNKESGKLSPKNHGGSQPMGLQIRDDRQMKALTGLSQAQFDYLLSVFSDMYQGSQQKTYVEGVESGTRRRKPGGGSKGKLPTIADKLLFLLYYFSRPPSKASRGQAKPTPPPRLRWGSPPGSARPNPSSSSIPKKPPSSYNPCSRKPG